MFIIFLLDSSVLQIILFYECVITIKYLKSFWKASKVVNAKEVTAVDEVRRGG